MQVLVAIGDDYLRTVVYELLQLRSVDAKDSMDAEVLEALLTTVPPEFKVLALESSLVEALPELKEMIARHVRQQTFHLLEFLPTGAKAVFGGAAALDADALPGKIAEAAAELLLKPLEKKAAPSPEPAAKDREKPRPVPKEKPEPVAPRPLSSHPQPRPKSSPAAVPPPPPPDEPEDEYAEDARKPVARVAPPKPAPRPWAPRALPGAEPRAEEPPVAAARPPAKPPVSRPAELVEREHPKERPAGRAHGPLPAAPPSAVAKPRPLDDFAKKPRERPEGAPAKPKAPEAASVRAPSLADLAREETGDELPWSKAQTETSGQEEGFDIFGGAPDEFLAPPPKKEPPKREPPKPVAGPKGPAPKPVRPPAGKPVARPGPVPRPPASGRPPPPPVDEEGDGLSWDVFQASKKGAAGHVQDQGLDLDLAEEPARPQTGGAKPLLKCKFCGQVQLAAEDTYCRFCGQLYGTTEL